MSKLMKLIRTLMSCTETSADNHAAYLDEAVDIPDLERRMREVEARNAGLTVAHTVLV
jgi:hypothetical protein